MDDAAAQPPAWHTWRRLLALMRPLTGTMAFSATMRVLNQLLNIALLAVGAYAVARLLSAPQGAGAGRWLGLMVLLGLFKGLTRYLEQFSGHSVAFHLLALLRNRVYAALEPLAPAALLEARGGDLVSRAVADVDRIEIFYAHTIAPVIAAVLVSAAALAGLAWLGGPAPALWQGAALLGIGLVLPLLAARAGAPVGSRTRAAVGELSAHVAEGIQGLRELLGADAGERRLQALDQRSRALAAVQQRQAAVSGLQDAGVDLLVATGLGGVLVWGLTQVQAGALELPALVVMLAVTAGSFGPALAVSGVVHELNQVLPSARRLFELMDRPPVVRDKAPGPVAALGPASLRFEDVHFRYPSAPAAWVHRGLGLEVQPGQTVALVGQSGSGKSSAVHLLLRFWDPERGRVSLGGHDVRSLPLEQLRAQVAVVSQHTYLFNVSIADNIRLGRPAATEAEVEQAARLADLHDFVAGLPRGYQTRVGELGTRVSGGQRQRLAIARAFLKDAPVLVLDEATSNLDPESELRIREALRRLGERRTTLIITHRLATIREAHRIFVLEAGQVVEQGTHAELAGRGGLYARLLAADRDDVDAVAEALRPA